MWNDVLGMKESKRAKKNVYGNRLPHFLGKRKKESDPLINEKTRNENKNHQETT